MAKHVKKQDGRKNNGGTRPGAGRKTDNPKPHTIRVTEEELKLIEQLRKKATQ